MHFFKTFVSTLLIAAPMAMAAPSADNSVGQSDTPEIDSAVKHLVGLLGEDESDVEARDLEARAGGTCAFLGGNKGCYVKCVAMGKSGGYCSKTNVCTCHKG